MYREPTVKGRKLGLKSMIWIKRKKKKTFSQNRMKKQEFKKKLGEAQEPLGQI